jgi:hypothetical protein
MKQYDIGVELVEINEEGIMVNYFAREPILTRFRNWLSERGNK